MFTPSATTFRAAKRLCICNQCQDSYGQCESFNEFQLNVKHIIPACTRQQQIANEESNEPADIDWGFLEVGSIVAVAPEEEQSADSFWFIRITEVKCVAGKDSVDSYGNQIPEGLSFLKGHFLERVYHQAKSVIYKEEKKLTFFYCESIFYPFVHMDVIDHGKNKGSFIITNEKYSDILAHVEGVGYSRIA